MATVLVVDDDLETRDLMARYLSQGGHNVVAAANGWEALIALDQQPVDLVLLDMMMPGMDGSTFMGIFHRTKGQRKTSVVVVSALDEARVQEKLGKYDIADILPKKGDFFTDLLDIVARHTGHHGGHHGAGPGKPVGI